MAELVNKKTAGMASAAENRAAPATRSVGQKAKGNDVKRLSVFMHALFFVLGFTIVFTVFGITAGAVGQVSEEGRRLTPYILKFGAILLVLFGLTTLGVFRWLSNQIRGRVNLDENPAASALVSILDFINALLYTERRVTEMHKVTRNFGYLSSTLMGMSFSAGWVPCVGPILGSILVIAGRSATVSQGAVLLALYSLGLGIPFLLTGAAFSSATGLLRRMNKYANIVSIISAGFLFFVAYLLWNDQFGAVASYFSSLTELALALEESISGALGINTGLIAVDPFATSMASDGISLASMAPLAILAGIISFISPCVLPLVPAYIGYLSGASLSGK